jgi:hypothetical protein
VNAKQRRTLTQMQADHVLRCPRCGLVVKGWPLVRPDNCGGGAFACIRQPEDVKQQWERIATKEAA